MSMSSNQSVVMEKDICEHILSVFAAILSNKNLIDEYKHLLPLIKPFFKINVDCDVRSSIFI